MGFHPLIVPEPSTRHLGPALRPKASEIIPTTNPKPAHLPHLFLPRQTALKPLAQFSPHSSLLLTVVLCLWPCVAAIPPVSRGLCVNFVPHDNHFFACICLFVFCFLELYLRHMEVPRLGVKLELQLPAYATATAMPIQAASATYTTTVHGFTGSLTH